MGLPDMFSVVPRILPLSEARAGAARSEIIPAISGGKSGRKRMSSNTQFLVGFSIGGVLTIIALLVGEWIRERRLRTRNERRK